MHVLLTGASGFVGSAVLHRLRSSPEIQRVRILTRDPQGVGHLPSAELVEGDLVRGEGLTGIASGIDVAIHAATYIGPDVGMARSVNDRGTAALVRECFLQDVPLVYVSTTAVYGPGPHRDLSESALRPGPVSEVSSTRATAETHVLAASGTVVRAALTYGRGDKWVIPAAIAGVRSAGGWIGGGGARLSMVHVDALAKGIAGLATRAHSVSGSVFHAASANPIVFKDMVRSAAKALGIALPSGDVPPDHPSLASVAPQLVQRAYVDHWYSSAQLTEYLGIDLGDGFALSRDDVQWYSTFLAEL